MYILCDDLGYDGHIILGVYTTEQKAKDAAVFYQAGQTINTTFMLFNIPTDDTPFFDVQDTCEYFTLIHTVQHGKVTPVSYQP